MIREIYTETEICSCIDVIRESFQTVADDLGLTKINCSTNATFIEEKHLKEMSEKGCFLFGSFYKEIQIGFVALEQSSNPDIWYLEKLAILPAYRHMGYGEELMDYCFEFVKSNNGKQISIGIIDDNKILKNWYINYGFKETHIQTFSHLPFVVCYLTKDVL